MIIGANRRQVVQNIKKNVHDKQFHAKAELGDPVMSTSEREKLVHDFWDMHERFSKKALNLMTRGLFDISALALTMGLKTEGRKHARHIPKAIITSNHYNQMDSLPIKRLALHYHKRLFFIIEDTNLKLPSWIGFLMRNVDSIPITHSIRYLGREFPEHLKNALDKNAWILIYPEQEMWFNYRKPRPVQKGAYYYAAQLNVPIISCFVEIRDKKQIEKGNPDFHKTRQILHVLPTIYPDPRLSVNQNAKRMRDIDYSQKKKAYEKAYGKKLTYDFSYDDIAGYIPEEGEK